MWLPTQLRHHHPADLHDSTEELNLKPTSSSSTGGAALKIKAGATAYSPGTTQPPKSTVGGPGLTGFATSI
jgi:hypothetical protein